MYKKQPCDDAYRDMKINGRRTKTLLYLLRIFCFTGVAFLKEGFISFGDLSDWQIVQQWHFGQFMTARLCPTGRMIRCLNWVKENVSFVHFFASDYQDDHQLWSQWPGRHVSYHENIILGQNRDKIRLELETQREETGLVRSSSCKKIDIIS